MKHVFNNGWEIIHQENGTGLLHIKPIPNSIFNTERYINVPEEAMNDLKNGEKNVFAIIKKYNLLDYIFQWQKVNPGDIKKIDTEDCYQGDDFFVAKVENKYFLSYLLARQGGGERRFEINKEIFNYARSRTVSLADIFKVYDLYKYDVD